MKRIIGLIGLYTNGAVIQTVGFKPKNIVHASFLHAVHKFYSSGIDEIIIVDLSPGGLDFELVQQYISQILTKCFIPVVYAGFVSSPFKADQLFRLGVDRILMCSQLLDGDFSVSSYIIGKYGSQALIAGIDADCFSLNAKCSSRLVSQPEPFTVKHHLSILHSLGVTEICLNSPVSDGLRRGYALTSDTPHLIEFANHLQFSLIAMGGAWEIEHFTDAANLGFSGLSAANCFHYREAYPLLIKKSLKNQGFDVVL